MLNWLDSERYTLRPSVLSPFVRFSPAEETIIENHQFSQTAIAHPVLRILNWNIAKNNYDPLWIQDFTKIIQQCQPDILFFQEVRVCSKSLHPFLIEEMGWHFAPNFIDDYACHHFGVLTASRIKPVSQRSMLTYYHEPFLKTPKVSLIVKYPLAWSDQTLLAVNIHGINFVSTRKFKSQILQLEGQLTKHQGPIILSGDFNTWSPYRMELLSTMATRLELKTVQFSDSCTSQLKRFLFSDPLDHIFYRGLEVRPHTARVLTQFSSSDHKPMVVELSVRA